MSWHLALLVLVTVFHTPVRVSGVEISVSPTSLNEGDTLMITCREQSLLPRVRLFVLGLQKANDAGGYDNLLIYNVNLDPGDPYLPTWGTTIGDIQQRANVTASFDAGKTSGFFELRIHSVRCSDPASFRCTMTSSTSGTAQSSNVQNVSIHGVTQSIEVTGADDCSTFIDPDCAMCQKFDDGGSQPRYAKMGQPLELTCSGQLATPQSQNRAIWYKQNVNDLQKMIITVNKTDLVYDPPAPNECTALGRSTMTYYPQNTDRELRITCEISSGSSVDTVSDEMSICVEGLMSVTTPPPQGTGTGPAEAGLGGGPIAGIVIGIIALIVLVVVLVYFLWYRRRDSGESYNTREADGRNGPPPVAKKPEMHENSMYDTTGDNQDNNYYGRSDRYNSGKVNRGMEDDYYHHDNDATPRSRDPIGSSV